VIGGPEMATPARDDALVSESAGSADPEATAPRVTGARPGSPVSTRPPHKSK
jgi:hypothetical protein